ncbi:alpha/beta fold hydrolase [Piscirickettsia salmonis]|uniref:alpha/beta fold hydrolase n=1 Tax=Piscirickettsia salmonis TaxID=1238 RepID=UPI001E2EF9B8|nr:alpha/beta hydrolase [Piscirickettsia salmonis]
MRNYDRTEELKKVNTPILVIHGEYDYIVVECAIHARDNLINAELVVLRDCSHDPFFEKPALSLRAMEC